MPREVAISGFTPDEILALSDADLAELVFCNEPVLFRIGSAEVLGEFRLCVVLAKTVSASSD